MQACTHARAGAQARRQATTSRQTWRRADLQARRYAGMQARRRAGMHTSRNASRQACNHADISRQARRRTGAQPQACEREKGKLERDQESTQAGKQAGTE
eukprot:3580576-Alexandrium_andersonii.AAC.1